MKGFYLHVKEAIQVNKERSKIYAGLTNGRSKSLSRLLIALEYLTLPIALLYDARGRKFNRNGIPIVANDFVPMDVKDPQIETSMRGTLNMSQNQEIKKMINEYSRSLKIKIWDQVQLEQVFETSLSFIKQIRAYEKDHKIHLSMLIHLVESLALIAKNGTGYAAMSDNKTIRLSSDLIQVHLMGIKRSMLIDARANIFHQEGIGIIVNDLPEIHF